MTKKRWTEDELQELLRLLKTCPTKYLTGKSIESFAKKHNRSKDAISRQAWALRKEYNIKSFFTEEDLKVIKECVKQYPYNLTLAFADAAVMLNVSMRSISDAYYRKILSNKKSFLFGLFNKNVIVKNRKNIWRNSKHIQEVRILDENRSLLEKIKKLIKRLCII